MTKMYINQHMLDNLANQQLLNSFIRFLKTVQVQTCTILKEIGISSVKSSTYLLCKLHVREFAVVSTYQVLLQ